MNELIKDDFLVDDAAEEGLEEEEFLADMGMRVVNESLFNLGKETEPYQESDIDAMIAQEWGLEKRKSRWFLKRPLRSKLTRSPQLYS